MRIIGGASNEGQRARRATTAERNCKRQSNSIFGTAIKATDCIRPLRQRNRDERQLEPTKDLETVASRVPLGSPRFLQNDRLRGSIRRKCAEKGPGNRWTVPLSLLFGPRRV